MKKLLKIFATATLIGTTSTNIIACGGGEKPISPTPNTITNLNTIITNKTLNSIYVGQLEKPNKEQILKAIKIENVLANNLTVKDFDFKQGNITTTSATIIGKNNYKNEISLSFNISNFKSINIIGISENYTIQSIKKIKNQIYISTNDGKIYKRNDAGACISMSGTVDIIQSLAVDSNNNIYAGSRNGTVYKSTDRSTFTEMSGTNDSIQCLTIDKNNNIYAGSRNGTVYKSTDRSTFTEMSGTVDIIKSLAVDSNNNIYAGSRNGTVYKSTDKSTFTAMSGTVDIIQSLAVDSNNNIYAGSSNGTVYKSTDRSTFTAMSGTNDSIQCLTIDKNNNIYAGVLNSKTLLYISEKLY